MIIYDRHKSTSICCSVGNTGEKALLRLTFEARYDNVTLPTLCSMRVTNGSYCLPTMKGADLNHIGGSDASKTNDSMDMTY